MEGVSGLHQQQQQQQRGKKNFTKILFYFHLLNMWKTHFRLKKLTRPQPTERTHTTHTSPRQLCRWIPTEVEILKAQWTYIFPIHFNSTAVLRVRREKNGFLSITNCCGITFQTFHICALNEWMCCDVDAVAVAGTILITLYTPSLYSGYTFFF